MRMVFWGADQATWSSTLKELVKEEEVGVIPYTLRLSYDYWTYRTYVVHMWKRSAAILIPWCFSLTGENTNKNADDIVTSILPEEDQDEIPVGFTLVGHIGIYFSPPNRENPTNPLASPPEPPHPL